MNDSEKEMKHLNEVLRSIRDINQLIIHERDVEKLVERACEIIVRNQGYFNAWIVLFPRGKDMNYIFSQQGLDAEFTGMEEFIRSGRLTKCARRALETGDIVISKDPPEECPDCLLSGKYEGRSGITAPLRYNTTNYGIIAVSIPKIYTENKEEIDLFREMVGDLGYALGSLENEEKKNKAFEIIKESEKNYRLLLNSANDMIYLHEILPGGMPGRILDANDQACRKTGYTKEELLRKTVADLNDPDYVEDIGEIGEKLKSRKNIVFEWVHIAKDGHKIPVETSVHQFVMEGKNVALAIVRDISERKTLEKELLLTLDATTDAIWKWNFKTGNLEFSPRYYTILGYEPGEFPATYESWVSLIHPDDRERALGVAEEYLKTKPGTYENEFRMRTKDGIYRWIHASAKVVEWDREGNAARLIGNHHDITDRVIREEKLKLTYFSVEKSPVSIFWIKADGSFFYVNDAACSELGYTRDELMGMRVDDVDPEYPMERRDKFWSSLKEQKTSRIQTSHKKKDGTVYPVELTTYYLKYWDKEFEIANSLDITERKLAEKAILESETKFRELFNNVSEAVFLHKVSKDNRRGNFVEVNDTACRRLGYTREELLNLSVADINTTEIRKDDEKRVKELKKAGSIEFEGVHVRKDGTEFPVFVKARIVEISGEMYILSLARDISGEKKTKKEQAELLKKIEENLVQMSTLNDRIRNPLCVIAGIVDLEGGENSEKILDQVNEIDDIINQLDRGWVESQKIRDYLKKHYGFDAYEMPDQSGEN